MKKKLPPNRGFKDFPHNRKSYVPLYDKKAVEEMEKEVERPEVLTPGQLADIEAHEKALKHFGGKMPVGDPSARQIPREPAKSFEKHWGMSLRQSTKQRTDRGQTRGPHD